MLICLFMVRLEIKIEILSSSTQAVLDTFNPFHLISTAKFGKYFYTPSNTVPDTNRTSLPNSFTSLHVSTLNRSYQPVHTQTPLVIASSRNHPDLVQLLLENGASCLADAEGETPFHVVCRYGFFACLEILLKTFDDRKYFDTRDKLNGWTPLLAASKLPDCE